MDKELPAASPGDAIEIARTVDEAISRAQEAAVAARAIDVRAKAIQQMGTEVLVARCPRCGTVAGLTGEGRHLCRTCHQWLRYIKDDGGEK